MDSGALLVCRVENTRWPVSEASRPIDTVSLSRISPTMITSGSARREGAHHGRKVEPGLAIDLHLAQPFWVISTGSSAVQILVSGC